MNPADPKNWIYIIDASAYTVQGMIYAFGLNYSTVQAWFRTKDPSTPRKATIEKMTPIMEKIQATKPIEKHPSFGYATPEQIEILFGGGVSPDRDKVLAKVQQQGKFEGKLYV